MSDRKYMQLIGAITALQGAVAAISKTLPDLERDIFATAMDELILQNERSATPDSDYNGGVKEVAQFLSTQARKISL